MTNRDDRATDRLRSIGALAERLAAGEPSALDDAFRAYFTPLRRYVHSYVRSWDIAEDIAQGVFVQLWVRIRQSELPMLRNVPSYLYNAARGDALDYLKHQKVEARHRASVVPSLMTHGHIELAEWEAELASRERLAALQQAVDTLPPRQREIMLLRLEQVSYKEIAVRLHLSVNTVEVHVQRSFARLRQVLKQFLA